MAAKVKLTVQTNFDEASKDIRNFGELTEQEMKRIDRALKKIKSEQLDAFVDKNKRAGAAITATRGKMAGLQSQHRSLERKIETLIRNGLDPQDKALQNLRKEYERTGTQIKTIETKQQNQLQITGMLKTGYLALGAALVGTTSALVKNTLAVAENGAEYGRLSGQLGLTAEELQELEYVGKRTGVTSDRLRDAIADMNEKIGEARLGSGTLNEQLEATNPALLEQVKNTKSSAEAFSLLLGELEKTTNEQDRTILATELFADAGKDLVTMANLGADGISKLREEARQYGIISNESARMSQRFVDKQIQMKSAIEGVRNQLGTQLMPMLINATEFVTSFITSFTPDQIERFGESTKFVFKGILMAGGIMVKGIHDIISGANTIIDQYVVNFYNIAGKLTGFVEKYVGFFSKVYGALGIDKLSNGIKKISDGVGEFSDLMNKSADAARESRDEAIMSWEKRNSVVQDYIKNVDKALTKEKSVSSANIIRTPGSSESTFEEVVTPKKPKEEKEKKDKEREKTLAERMASEQELLRISNQRKLEEMDLFYQGMEERAILNGENKVNRLNEELTRIDEIETLNAEEKVLAKQALEKRLADIAKKAYEDEKKMMELRVSLVNKMANATMSILGGLIQFQKNTKGEYRALAIFQKAIAIAQIGIETRKAAMAALNPLTNPVPKPMRVAESIGLIAAGVTNAAAVASTPIPSAETGGRFIASMEGTQRTDGTMVKVNPGETLDVTPRSEENERSVTIVNKFNEEEFWRSTQRGIDANYITFTADNLVGGI